MLRWCKNGGRDQILDAFFQHMCVAVIILVRDALSKELRQSHLKTVQTKACCRLAWLWGDPDKQKSCSSRFDAFSKDAYHDMYVIVIVIVIVKHIFPKTFHFEFYGFMFHSMIQTDRGRQNSKSSVIHKLVVCLITPYFEGVINTLIYD